MTQIRMGDSFSNGLSGSLPQEIEDLSYLTRFDLRQNNV